MSSTMGKQKELFSDFAFQYKMSYTDKKLWQHNGPHRAQVRLCKYKSMDKLLLQRHLTLKSEIGEMTSRLNLILKSHVGCVKEQHA